MQLGEIEKYTAIHPIIRNTSSKICKFLKVYKNF